ncbi:5703_t:CDS:2, partial [Cetraspora pellucida]
NIAIKKIKCPYNKSRCYGNFVVQKRSKNTANAPDEWFIGCSCWWEQEKGKHFFQALKKDINPILLNKLFKNELINLLNDTNSCSVILSTKSHSNLIKATFGTNYLSEVHVSLNNIDKLRHLVSKVQKEQNPYGQEILGLTYNIWKRKKEYDDYVQQAGSLNHLYSFIKEDIWYNAPDNTNVAE